MNDLDTISDIALSARLRTMSSELIITEIHKIENGDLSEVDKTKNINRILNQVILDKAFLQNLAQRYGADKKPSNLAYFPWVLDRTIREIINDICGVTPRDLIEGLEPAQRATLLGFSYAGWEKSQCQIVDRVLGNLPFNRDTYKSLVDTLNIVSESNYPTPDNRIEKVVACKIFYKSLFLPYIRSLSPERIGSLKPEEIERLRWALVSFNENDPTRRSETVRIDESLPVPEAIVNYYKGFSSELSSSIEQSGFGHEIAEIQEKWEKIDTEKKHDFFKRYVAHLCNVFGVPAPKVLLIEDAKGLSGSYNKNFKDFTEAELAFTLMHGEVNRSFEDVMNTVHHEFSHHIEKTIIVRGQPHFLEEVDPKQQALFKKIEEGNPLKNVSDLLLYNSWDYSSSNETDDQHFAYLNQPNEKIARWVGTYLNQKVLSKVAHLDFVSNIDAILGQTQKLLGQASLIADVVKSHAQENIANIREGVLGQAFAEALKVSPNLYQRMLESAEKLRLAADDAVSGVGELRRIIFDGSNINEPKAEIKAVGTILHAFAEMEEIANVIRATLGADIADTLLEKIKKPKARLEGYISEEIVLLANRDKKLAHARMNSILNQQGAEPC